MDPAPFAPVGVFPRQVIDFVHDLPDGLTSGTGNKLFVDKLTNEFVLRFTEEYIETWHPTEAINLVNFDRLVKEPSALYRDEDEKFWYLTTSETAMSFDFDCLVIWAVTEHLPDPNDAESFDRVIIDRSRLVIDRKRPRPRNQFILYRQWMSFNIRKENPNFNAGILSQLISKFWHDEPEYVKHGFKSLAHGEALLYQDPAYFINFPRQVRRIRTDSDDGPFLPWGRRRHLAHNPMTIAQRLIAAGH
ncbi:hypothetical protein B0T22DRAFT_508799 [Podospora appendiculata]|uniref:HMG box domain-containing protein n=1 Tax=Podospora appendiculata TaxID=314037 RepID=A0AAE1CI98_9PEZI|nr:hypothetical protein B0T22DRAFT_508799 [Podospora appendiculata]